KAVRDHQVDGLKIYPPCGYTASSRLLYPYYEICRNYRIPVLSHIGATSPALEFEPARPIYVDVPARDFPEIDFILAHGALHYADECLMLCENRPNIYVD